MERTKGEPGATRPASSVEMGEQGRSPSESYAGVLKGRLAHAPRDPSKAEEQALAEKLKLQERVEPELVAAASHLGQHAKFHPTRASLGEELPDNLYRSSTGFLINKSGVEVKLDKDKVRKEMEFFQKHVVIAYFVGGSPSYLSVLEWIGSLKAEIKEECRLGREIGNGFFQIITNAEASTQTILMLSPHLSKWGTCIMQPWVADFNPSKPIGLKLPVWITLKGVRDELLSSAQELAAGIGVVLGRHRNNSMSSDQKFCVAVQSGKPFDLEIITENPVTGEAVTIQVDYNNLPIRCRLCLSTSHLIRDCEKSSTQRKATPHHNAPKNQLPQQGKTLPQISTCSQTNKRIEISGGETGKDPTPKEGETNRATGGYGMRGDDDGGEATGRRELRPNAQTRTPAAATIAMTAQNARREIGREHVEGGNHQLSGTNRTSARLRPGHQ